ncbi:ImmA/IrrE family metallo-endopeptidase [Solibacillus sp. NPDC093137]|uniref:ImmA/IrrE family metallo-endopeptidase n=1 Tax=Solibacillus sp. NPDC093137 TaxID=3390678 RepID=UPI003CFE5888
MINKENIREVILTNRKLLPGILSKVDEVLSKGIQFKFKPLQSIQSYLIKNAEVILAPSKSLSYGGMVLYRNSNYYIHINTLQPKTYQNFVWGHEFYHFEFEKERIQNVDEPTFINNPALDIHERMANLFAAELLINNDSLKVLFNEVMEQNPNDRLEVNIIRLIPYFELPYKSLVIKLAQEGLISIDQAEVIIELQYRNYLPTDFDLSILEPTKAIRVDSLNILLEKTMASNVLHDSDIDSIISIRDKHLKDLDAIRYNKEE